MKRIIMAVTSLAAAGLLSGCIQETGVAGMPSAAEQACLQRTSMETNNGDVVLLSSRAVAGGTEVIVGVGPQRARWQCTAYNGGGTSRPMSLTNEGYL